MSEEKLEQLKNIVLHQAEMETLFNVEIKTIREHCLAMALRHLHAVIEDDHEIAEQAKKVYWNLESEL